MSYEIINPESLGVPRGWNNGMLAPKGGRVLFIAGQTAPDAGGFVQQFAAVLDRVLTVLREAGGKPEDIGRLTFYVTDLDEYRESLKPLGIQYRERMGKHFPATALVGVKGLVDPRAKVEVEATAVLA